MDRLVPANVAAPAENAGRIPFAFGRRFFLLLFIGLAWIAPAWKEPRFLYAMVLWDVLALAFWAWDLGQHASARSARGAARVERAARTGSEITNYDRSI